MYLFTHTVHPTRICQFIMLYVYTAHRGHGRLALRLVSVGVTRSSTIVLFLLKETYCILCNAKMLTHTKKTNWIAVLLQDALLKCVVK